MLFLKHGLGQPVKAITIKEKNAIGASAVLIPMAM